MTRTFYSQFLPSLFLLQLYMHSVYINSCNTSSHALQHQEGAALVAGTFTTKPASSFSHHRRQLLDVIIGVVSNLQVAAPTKNGRSKKEYVFTVNPLPFFPFFPHFFVFFLPSPKPSASSFLLFSCSLTCLVYSYRLSLSTS